MLSYLKPKLLRVKSKPVDTLKEKIIINNKLTMPPQYIKILIISVVLLLLLHSNVITYKKTKKQI